MKHGVITGQTFEGTKLNPASVINSQKIGLGISNTYRFVGHKTTILRYLIDNKDYKITCLKSEHIHVKVADVAQNATEAFMNSFKGAALGVAGDANAVIDAANNVLDGIATVTTALGFFQARTPALKRPGKFAYAKDHALNSKIIVDLKGIAPSNGPIIRVDGFADVGVNEMVFEDLAVIVNEA